MIRGALALVLLAPLALGARALPEPVSSALARAHVPAGAVAVLVVPAEGDTALVSHRASAPMNPASVVKLITSYAALDLLGPAFTFHTDVFTTGEIAGGVLAGDLIIRGGGDPKLTYERLWQLAHQLRARGLREIRGDVIIDRGYFAPIAHDPASFDQDPKRAYNAGPDALLVNWQAIEFSFIPGEGRVRISAEPDLPNVEIASRLQLTTAPCGAWRSNLRYDIEEQGLIATVTFSGTYAADCGERSWPLSLFDGPRFTESVLRWLWSESGGVLRGKVRSGTTPEQARLFYRHESEPLANLVRDMNKFSNNLMARQLFLALSAEGPAPPGEAHASERIVQSWLASKGIEAPELVIENGSGLSRNERSSAATLAAVLKSAWSSPLMPELAASLPVFAVDGTLKSRPSAGAAGQAHVKGGTLTGVQSIAGYVLDRGAKRWIVVMLVNHANANAAQSALDALIEWVHRHDAKEGMP
ncbi:MAG TPA: D-alanyl-D-alanine carboxypeptidase/D-alanyl-D-alanine-endopeptidase [Usitatibacter sp.]|nr:D-alanyl-D-alanine carboxypeptidase/D-alanyl-D-alanine-endopeptidase [Usitatibacter sp.]